jgi:MazG family protein
MEMQMKPDSRIETLLAIMAKLRDPNGGCPWDLEQDFTSIAPYTIEEAYEVADAIQRGDIAGLKDELGDLLLQVVYHSQMARETGAFAFDDVVRAISDKMVRRHPHVFGDAQVASSAAQTRSWEVQKQAERAQAGKASVLDGVALALPALKRAEKLQARAARVGFDWPAFAPTVHKVREELGELSEAVAADEPQARLQEEVGDLLFAMVNVARKLEIDPETALRGANAKFERRFHAIEAALAERGKTPDQSSLEEMDALWDGAKDRERGRS